MRRGKVRKNRKELKVMEEGRVGKGRGEADGAKEEGI